MCPKFLPYFIIATSVLVTLVFGDVDKDGFCEAAGANFRCNNKAPDCGIKIDLEKVEDSWKEIENKIFFVESSGRPYLKGRQLCSVESALETNPELKIIVVITSPILDLSASNATCQIYSKYDGSGSLFFRHSPVPSFFSGTPLDEITSPGGRISRSQNPVVNLSDALRLVLVHRFGGWYADLDMIFLKSIKDLKNVFASDQLTLGDIKKDPSNYGDSVSNAIFHLDRGHELLSEAMEAFSETFNGDWASGGPLLLTKVLMKRCGFEGRVRMSPEVFTLDRCGGIGILSPRSFYPVGWFDTFRLKEMRDDRHWEEFFKDSYTAHYYDTSNRSVGKILKPRHYGAERPALLYLATRLCPVSFDSQKIF